MYKISHLRREFLQIKFSVQCLFPNPSIFLRQNIPVVVLAKLFPLLTSFSSVVLPTCSKFKNTIFLISHSLRDLKLVLGHFYSHRPFLMKFCSCKLY